MKVKHAELNTSKNLMEVGQNYSGMGDVFCTL